MIIPAIFEHPLQLLILLAAFWLRKTPLLSIFLLLFFISRQFLFVHNLPLAFWQSISISMFVVAISAVFWHHKSKRNLIPIVCFVVFLPIPFGFYEIQDIPGDIEIRQLFEQHGVLGGVVALKLNNTDYVAGYGQTHRFGSLPNEQTYYPIASVSKVFTGHILSKAFEQQWVPYATHTSGLPDVPGLPNFWKNYGLAPTDFWAHYSVDDLTEDVGGLTPIAGQWEYSNTGFCLLGQHLNIQDKALGGIGYYAPDDAKVAGAISNGGMSLPLWGNNACFGAGGRMATAPQLMNFIVQDSSAKTIYYQGNEHIMGLGWHYKDGLWYHAGATFGNTSFVVHDPKTNNAMVILVSGVIQNMEKNGLELFQEIAILENKF